MDKEKNFYKISGLLLFLVAWEVAGRSGISADLIPSFTSTFKVMVSLIIDGTYLDHGYSTVVRAYTGFLLATVAGIFLGVLIGWSWRTRAFFDFLIDFLRNVSSITLIPITVLLIGIGFTQKVSVITYAAFFPIVLSTINGVASTERNVIDAARSMGASDYEVMRHVVLYSALPSIFTGLRLSMGVAFIVVIAAELVGATSGLGFYLQESQRTYRITEMFATALFISIIGYISNKIVVFSGSKLIDWRESDFTGI